VKDEAVDIAWDYRREYEELLVTMNLCAICQIKSSEVLMSVPPAAFDVERGILRPENVTESTSTLSPSTDHGNSVTKENISFSEDVMVHEVPDAETEDDHQLSSAGPGSENEISPLGEESPLDNLPGDHSPEFNLGEVQECVQVNIPSLPFNSKFAC
jgi:hypothetical protein